MLISRRFCAKGKRAPMAYSSRMLSIKNVSGMSVSMMRRFSCITLKRLRKTREIRRRGVHCYKALLGCSIDRTGRGGALRMIRLGRGKDRPRVRGLPLRPLHSMQGLHKALRRVLRTRSKAKDRSCIDMALASRISPCGPGRRLREGFRRVLRIQVSGREAERGLRFSRRRVQVNAPFRAFYSFCGRVRKRRVSRRRRGVLERVLDRIGKRSM